ncbi:MAG: hypothetical protein LBP37_01395, partial [Spirochaetaceae bacterium]|nr:hypothetical protein [Spirochaetaceae bacterium]
MNRGIAGNLSGIAAAALFALVSCVMENGDTPASRPVESVAFNFGADTRAGNGGGKPSITLNVKESYDLAGALVFTPPDADNKGVSWYIDEAVPSGKLNGADVKAVTLDTETGVITAAVTRAAYEAIPEAQRELPVTVGVITDDGNKSAECAVNVVFTPVPVASVAINGGASSLNLFAGETAALTAAVSPANANNYTL